MNDDEWDELILGQKLLVIDDKISALKDELTGRQIRLLDEILALLAPSPG